MVSACSSSLAVTEIISWQPFPAVTNKGVNISMPQKLEEIFAEHLGKSVFTGIYNLPANT